MWAPIRHTHTQHTHSTNPAHTQHKPSTPTTHIQHTQHTHSTPPAHPQHTHSTRSARPQQLTLRSLGTMPATLRAIDPALTRGSSGVPERNAASSATRPASSGASSYQTWMSHVRPTCMDESCTSCARTLGPNPIQNRASSPLHLSLARLPSQGKGGWGKSLGRFGTNAP